MAMAVVVVVLVVITVEAAILVATVTGVLFIIISALSSFAYNFIIFTSESGMNL